MKHLILAALLAPSIAFAHGFSADKLIIAHPMAFETTPTAQTADGYMVIMNNGDTADRLLAVKADFPKVTLHSTVEQDGIARMQELDAIDIPPMAQTPLQPGGLHIMFMGLNGDPFEVGEEIPATLVFEKAGEVPVTFHVEPRGAGAIDHSNHGVTN
ncbi:copper chaperone PCu(A)C [Cognatishimia sp. MH4019]|uniref:copper chaperone PCu(A)C n=1 Tax=Cognatishimia sp. MH4019 TaxID=2854030 RepID=UPI001CD26046|nr:copper chaperone PCu(A)C [Cognatishimia sp. MH4019]